MSRQLRHLKEFSKVQSTVMEEMGGLTRGFSEGVKWFGQPPNTSASMCMMTLQVQRHQSRAISSLGYFVSISWPL